MKGVFHMSNVHSQSLDFFMGALSPKGGFRGYFSHLNQQPDLWLYLIKAGPGCGKSTLMAKLAEKSPLPVERIHCSSDPDSLDGVVFPHKQAAILDATAPHVVEPDYPGAKQTVVNLFDTLSEATLYENRQQIRTLFDTCSALQKKANRCIRCASLLLEEMHSLAYPALDTQKLLGYVQRLGHRLLPTTDGTPVEHLRLLSAVTPKGELCWKNTVSAVANHVVVFEDCHGVAARLAMEQLRQQALHAGYEIYTCICPLSPEESPEHILIPALHLAFVTSNHWHPMEFTGQQTIHCTRFFEKEQISRHKNQLRLCQKAVDELLAQTSLYQRQAKENHDKLEVFYRSAANFEAVNAITQQVEKKIGL